MPRKKSYILLAGIGTVLFATLIVANAKAASVVPDQSDGWQPCSQERHGQMAVQRAQVEQAFIDQDYQAWRALVGAEKFPSITEQNFEKFAQLHELRQAGDWESIKAVADELGLPKLNQKISRPHRHHFPMPLNN